MNHFRRAHHSRSYVSDVDYEDETYPDPWKTCPLVAIVVADTVDYRSN